MVFFRSLKMKKPMRARIMTPRGTPTPTPTLRPVLELDEVVLAGEALGDEALVDEALGDKALVDEALGDETLEDEALANMVRVSVESGGLTEATVVSANS